MVFAVLWLRHYLLAIIYLIYFPTPPPLLPLCFLVIKPGLEHGVTFFMSITYLIWPFPGFWRLPARPSCL